MRLTAILILAALAGGCSTLHFPGVHKITIQQGNVISLAMIDKLRPGMTKSQVRFVLGNPVVEDPLNQERWDYYYSIQIGGADPIRRVLKVYFADGRLTSFEGDFVPTAQKKAMDAAKTSTS